MAARRTDLPPAKELAKLIRYDPETGALTFLERPASMFPAPRHARTWNKRFARTPALNVKHHNGYLIGEIGGRVYSAHRIAWYLTHGKIPNEIDHINGKRSDNRLVNLRSVDRTANCRNIERSQTNNTSGAIGVCWDRGNAKWIVRVGKKHVGRFASFDEAVAARKVAQVKQKYHPNHGRDPAGSD